MSGKVFDLNPESAIEQLHQHLIQTIHLRGLGKKFHETIRTENLLI
jgi:hypothetical protein